LIVYKILLACTIVSHCLVFLLWLYNKGSCESKEELVTMERKLKMSVRIWTLYESEWSVDVANLMKVDEISRLNVTPDKVL